MNIEGQMIPLPPPSLIVNVLTLVVWKSGNVEICVELRV